ncbi:MAG: heavy metal translocating P-type ATPase [Acidipropionibacterium sp.]|jgi:heavy metal translocating P-type ATPase|nr:heavy metal translocating P-type ATPase [Acidipropionibacterium sp.]
MIEPMKTGLKLAGRYPLVILVCATALIGAVLGMLSQPTATRWVISLVCLAVAARLAVGMIRDLRSGRYGVDLLAIVAILAAAAVGEYWASLVICLMVTGGEALEDYASARAGRSLSALLDNAPHEVGRINSDGLVDRISVDQVNVGDRIQVRPGEMVGVDGLLQVGNATVDESSLTGESMPVLRRPGEQLMAGSVNGPTAVVMRATATAADSQYQRIVALVREAQDSRAPFVSLADRVAVPFTAVSLAIAGLAWFLSGDAVRFAEVLVVATPCPLIIAAPVAFMAGTSRAAKLGIIVRDSGALEQLARVRTAAFDKTGTLTRGTPAVTAIHPSEGVSDDRVLELAAAVEQMSTHPIATAITSEARRRGIAPQPVEDAQEVTAAGIGAVLEGRRVRVGTQSFAGGDAATRQKALDSSLTTPATPTPAGSKQAAATRVYVSCDERLIGVIEASDPVRPEAVGTLAELARLGVGRTMMLTGDSRATADLVAGQLGVSTARAGLTPADKVEAVRSADRRPVMMVGDGVNDAPVLAVADVGVAMGAKGSAAAVESADVVVMEDDLFRVARAVQIGRRTLSVAWQAIGIGIGLSLALMLVGATGAMPAVVGAGLQELVDLACILWALLSGRPGRAERLHASLSNTDPTTGDASGRVVTADGAAPIEGAPYRAEGSTDSGLSTHRDIAAEQSRVV